MKGGYLYILASSKNGTLYTGVTARLAERIAQHRSGNGSEFVRKYGVNRLVFVERYDRIEEAIAREKQIKGWKRTWKVALIEQVNSDWSDLYNRLNW
jgi:putative endonuclease